MTEVAVDSSAILALLLDEPEAPTIRRLLADVQPVMSLATRIELIHAVQRKMGPEGVAVAEMLLDALQVRFEAFDDRQARTGLAAINAFGRGRGQEPAVLNFGDTFSYALAKTLGLPLLYKGADFARTDIAPALEAAPPVPPAPTLPE